MVRSKLSPIVTSNTLEFVIEYMLISSILNRICEMTTKPWQYPRDDTWLVPLWHLLKIRTWGIEWKKAIDKTNEWVAWWWQWASAKINQKKITLNYKHFQGGYGRLPLGDVYTCQWMHESEKVDSRTFFHKHIEWFFNKRFGNPW